jgi:transcriptional regulator with XRE-family HTH domain
VRTYGEHLRAIRKALGLSQEAMAARLGYKRQGNLSLYEADKKQPSVQTVLRHAAVCGQLPSEFLTDVIVTDYDRIRAGAYDATDVVYSDGTPRLPCRSSAAQTRTVSRVSQSRTPPQL